MELEGRFATDQGCREYLFALRWPEGFVCPRCGGRQAWAASELLSRRVHVPLQPPDVRVPGQAVLSVDPASRSGRAAPLPDFGPPPGIGGGGVKCIPSFVLLPFALPGVQGEAPGRPRSGFAGATEDVLVSPGRDSQAVDLADQVATLTEAFPRGYCFPVDQLNRAALSIAANLAEPVADAVTRESPRGDIAVTSGVTFPGDVTASDGYVALTAPQHWILDQLRDGVELPRAMVEKHCGIDLRQAKRELTGLSTRGLIEFKRRPRPGHYALRQKPSRS